MKRDDFGDIKRDKYMNGWYISKNCLVLDDWSTVIESGKEKKITGQARALLKLLIENKQHNRVVGFDLIGKTLWPETGWGYDRKDSLKEVLKQVRSIIGCNKNNRIIQSRYDDGYILCNELVEYKETDNSLLSYMLTTQTTFYVDENDILHREKEINELIELLKTKKSTILLSGFGGIGKTSIARVLYSKLMNQYDSVGWIEYIDDMKTSILSSFEMDEDILNQENRWKVIYNKLKNTKQRTLLFIDNVDIDESRNQNPLEDQILSSITGLSNVSIVLTSRLESITGYHTYSVDFLSKESCIDLFMHYYGKEVENTYYIEKLIERAGYHTFGVELLAKSAKRNRSLKEFYGNIETIGFNYPSMKLRTNYKNLNDNIINHLKNLFNLQTRSKEQISILHGLSLFPNTVLTWEEIQEWLGYDEEVLYDLIDAGWLTNRNDGIYMHPLMKEMFHIEKIEMNSISKLYELIIQNTYFNEQDPLNAFNRKFDMFLSFIQFMDLNEYALSVYEDVAKYSQKYGKIQYAIQYFRKVLDILLYTVEDSDEYQAKLAKAYMDLGYQLSYTSRGIAEANELLKKSMEIYLELYNKYPNKYDEQYAKACDNLGYLNISSNVVSSRLLLCIALELRKNLNKKYPGKYEHEVAWTMDNYGYILSLENEQQELAEMYLREALAIREKLEMETPGKYTTEVAWTCKNLAMLLQMKDDYEEACLLYDRSIQLIKEADSYMPHVHDMDLIQSYNNKSIMIKDTNLLMNCYSLLTQMDDYLNLYPAETIVIILNMASISKDKEISLYWFKEGLSIWESMNPKNIFIYNDLYISFQYNLGVYYYKNKEYELSKNKLRIVLNKHGFNNTYNIKYEEYEFLKKSLEMDLYEKGSNTYDIEAIERFIYQDDTSIHLEYMYYAMSGSRVIRI